MSALAIVAKAWGAEVGGSDRARTPYVELLERHGIDVVIGHAAENVPPGYEIVASSAIAATNPEVGSGAKRRGELLAELVELRPSIVVAGAHGKTTTTSMIAFVLDRLGLDPAFLIGGDVPQLGGNAGRGRGGSSPRGTSPTARCSCCARRSPSSRTSSSITMRRLRRRPRSSASSPTGSRGLPDGAAVVRGADLDPPSDLVLAVPGEHNRLNAACALAALAAAGVDGAAARGGAHRVPRRRTAVRGAW